MDKMREKIEAIAEAHIAKLCEVGHKSGLVIVSYAEIACENAITEALAWQAAQTAAVPVVGDVPTAEQVGEEIGMHASAWDCVDPEKIIAAVLKLSKPTISITAAELDALRKDAERYQWLRDKSHSLETRQYDKGIRNGPSCYHEVEGIRELKYDAALDAAIDAAIAGEKK